jgi:hypothetical protein
MRKTVEETTSNVDIVADTRREGKINDGTYALRG